MEKSKRMITDTLERKAFEQLIRNVFNKYKDNMMCSKDTMEEIITDDTKKIREQLQGVSHK